MSDEFATDHVLTPTSLVGRLFAFFIDFIVVAVILLFSSFLIDEVIPRRTLSRSNQGLFDLLVYLAFGAAPIMYFSIMESSKLKATVGKLVTGIEVVDENSFQGIGFSRALGRAIVKLVSIYFCGIGLIIFIFAFSSQNKQAIHDGLFRTLVVDK